MNIVILHAWLSAKISVKTERGAGLAEYALILVLVSIAAIATLGPLGDAIAGVFADITDALP